MDEQGAPAEEVDERSPFERFQQLTRALFRVDRRDVAPHTPTQRTPGVSGTSSAEFKPDAAEE
jgi:hypothetical protein